MARKRNYAAEYARRQERARTLGFESYYARRVRRGAPPSAPRPSGRELRAARGHAGFRDLLRELGDGDIIGIDGAASTRDPTTGRWTNVKIHVIDVNGREHTYTMRNVSDEKVQDLLDRIESVGAISSPAYPIAGLMHVEGPELPEAEAA